MGKNRERLGPAPWLVEVLLVHETADRGAEPGVCDVEQHECEQEIRRGEADETQERERVVADAVLTGRRIDTDRKRDNPNEDNGRKRNDEGQQQLIAEGRVLASLDHPGLVRVYDLDMQEGRPFAVLEYIPSHSLQQEIQRGMPVSRRAADLAAQLARTMAYVHKRGICHRDLKPANVLIDQSGRPRVVDFGLALADQPWGQPNSML